jgi:hypothetical protein
LAHVATAEMGNVEPAALADQVHDGLPLAQPLAQAIQ